MSVNSNKKKAKNSHFCVLGHDIRKFNSNQRHLIRILQDTQKSLKDVEEAKILPYELRFFDNILQSQKNSLQQPTLVVIGPARTRLVNFLLGKNILPSQENSSSGKSTIDKTKCWRWLRLQFGTKKLIRLSFGTDIEVIEPSLFTESKWDQIPYETLRCNDASDLSTVMDIYLCHPLLEQGLQIIVPPDLSSDRLIGMLSQNSTDLTYHDLLFCTKEESPLANTFPIILYAIDNVNNVDTKSKNIDINYENVEDKNNLFNCVNDTDNVKKCDENGVSKCCVKNRNFCQNNSKINSEIDLESSCSNSGNFQQLDNLKNIDMESQYDCDGLSDEDLLDLRQIYELHPNSQVLFVLFDDATTSQFVSSPSYNDGNIGIDNYDSENCIENNVNKCCEVDERYKNLVNVKDDFKDEHNSNPITNFQVFTTEEDKDKLFKKQSIYLSSLVEQLRKMTKPILKTKCTSQWMIVDDHKTNETTECRHIKKDCKKNNHSTKAENQCCVLQRDDFIHNLVSFTRECLQGYVLQYCSDLSEVHYSLLQKFIMSSYDMARQIQVIPKRIHYVAEMEKCLYMKLLEKFTGQNKLQELHSIIESVIQDMRDSINAMDWSDYNCCGSQELSRISNSEYGSPESVNSQPSDLNTDEHKVLEKTIDSMSNSLENSFSTLTINRSKDEVNVTKVDSLDECVEASIVTEKSLNNNAIKLDEDSINSKDDSKIENEINLNVEVVSVLDFMDSGDFSSENSNCADGHHLQSSFKEISMNVQRIILAKLSRNISIRLVKYIDCLRDNYFGTLQRCLEALEENLEIRSASKAVRSILLVTRSVDLEQCASFSLLNLLVDQVRRFFNGMFSSLSKHFKGRGVTSTDLNLSGESSRMTTSCCLESYKWKKSVAHQTVNSLNATKLCKIISTQLKDRIRISHEQFQSALLYLSEYHSERLQNTEELKVVVRKIYAPKFARLYLESMSMADLVKYGLPCLGKEIGRGHYGVVYTLKGTWAGCCPLAIKSVVPPDSKHFDELAMEYFQNRNIPPHNRIVGLVGSVVDYSYGSDRRLPAILLVSERLKWDLECALSQDTMPFEKRMQIAIDVVEGIRYLHSQGLVHRDIKMKNILLDESNRAKITDLGFCIPESMISGSVVGTPLHMAPELLKGPYDFSVDVYAFGILFWFICSGQVQVPTAFNNFYTKEQLWYSVCKGVRPERLQIFSDVCWDIMKSCWSGEPNRRPFLGDIQTILEHARDFPREHIVMKSL